MTNADVFRVEGSVDRIRTLLETKLLRWQKDADQIASTFAVNESGQLKVSSAQHGRYNVAVNTAKALKTVLNASGELLQ